MQVFIQSNQTGRSLVGRVWPGETNFPDFNSPNSFSFWSEGLSNISKNYGIVEPSGIWIDMNEYSNFINGEIVPERVYEDKDSFLNPFPSKFDNEFSNPPFNPQGILHPLYQRTLSLDAMHYHGEDALLVKSKDYNQIIYEWDWHNLNGFSEGIATHSYL